ncbi:DUF5986 family protein [uncultured Lactobacillus sp.]|uniref:DUF5986 family protein n=1 Tax=uncultured Lactobacillus sp. TaxID=153152 RepID=UPI002583A972|nr:DUF5986 family protein [uncultured Lactobacillus sp.]
MEKIATDYELLKIITPALKIPVGQIRDDYAAFAGGKYDNGIPGSIWDRRFNEIASRISSIKKLHEIPIDRHIWKTMSVFNDKDSTLYLFTSRKNFFKIQKEIQDGKHSHYMYALTAANPVVSKQLSFDGLEDDADGEERLEEAKEILGDNFNRVKRTYIITYDYYEDAAVDGTIFLVDTEFNTIDRVAIPEFKAPTPEDEDRSTEHENKKVQEDKTDRIVKWNPNKTKRSTTNRESINDTSN